VPLVAAVVRSYSESVLEESVMRHAHILVVVSNVALVAAGTAWAQTAKPSVAERVVIDSPYAIRVDPEAAAFVTAAAEKAIKEHCASCHGADLRGRLGVPNLIDYEFLWGITFEETNDVGPVAALEQTIRYGIRNQDCPAVTALAPYGDCPDTRYSEMPGFLAQGTLTVDQIRDLTEYVLKISGQQADAVAAARGQVDFEDDCTECHGEHGTGYKPYGGPNLTDKIWLYGADRASITASISAGRMGRCPAWVGKLDAATIKALAVYLWNKLGQG
jgi:cytochrome c oxidase cbb3-type subunit III